MAPSRDDLPAEHYDEFELQVSDLRRTRGSPWDAILSLGRQVSAVRHDVAEMRQERNNFDFRLFGDRELRVPGKFDELQRNIDEVKNLVTAKAAEQAQTTLDAAADLKAEHEAKEKWWQSFWGRAGIGFGALYAIAQTVLLIVNAVAHHA